MIHGAIPPELYRFCHTFLNDRDKKKEFLLLILYFYFYVERRELAKSMTICGE